jgi:hypothetical protein
MEIVNWVIVNYVEVLKVVAYVIAIASVVVKLTPTQADDAILAKIMPWIEKIALNKKV